MADEFFKVFVPSRSSEFLRLPRAFIKRSNSVFPKDATLKDDCGNLWHMEVEKDENDVSLKNGWPKFATDYLLEFGDFLHFTHNGDSEFDVMVYGKDGCRKDNFVSIKEKNKELDMIPMPVKLEDEPKERKNRPKSIGNSKQKDEDLCKAPKGKSRRTTPSMCEASKTNDSSENPHFIASVRPKTAPYHLNIPTYVLRKEDLEDGKKMVLDTQDGKMWPVVIRIDADRCCFAKGWKIFWTRNNLEKEDQCRFEFSRSKNGTLKEKILVTILPVNTKK